MNERLNEKKKTFAREAAAAVLALGFFFCTSFTHASRT